MLWTLFFLEISSKSLFICTAVPQKYLSKLSRIPAATNHQIMYQITLFTRGNFLCECGKSNLAVRARRVCRNPINAAAAHMHNAGERSVHTTLVSVRLTSETFGTLSRGHTFVIVHCSHSSSFARNVIRFLFLYAQLLSVWSVL